MLEEICCRMIELRGRKVCEDDGVKGTGETIRMILALVASTHGKY